MNKPIIITGPTATGKTALGALLAKEINGEIISADSMQIYKFMDIGTAKPTHEEMLGVPHHMIDIIPPWEDYSAARYVAEATKCIEEIFERGKQPIIVGGTGLYIDSLVAGREFSARGNNEHRRILEEKYDNLGGEKMLLLLESYDPESASKLHANDKKRIVRAIEVYETTGTTISKHNMDGVNHPVRFQTLKYALTFTSRAQLYTRIDRRVDDMISRGLEKEVTNLLSMGLHPNATAMQAIGYKEMTTVLKGDTTLEEAIENIKMQSRRYAKRQLSWLRRDSQTKWIAWNDTPDIYRGVREIMEQYEAK